MCIRMTADWSDGRPIEIDRGADDKDAIRA